MNNIDLLKEIKKYKDELENKDLILILEGGNYPECYLLSYIYNYLTKMMHNKNINAYFVFKNENGNQAYFRLTKNKNKIKNERLITETKRKYNNRFYTYYYYYNDNINDLNDSNSIKLYEKDFINDFLVNDLSMFIGLHQTFIFFNLYNNNKVLAEKIRYLIYSNNDKDIQEIKSYSFSGNESYISSTNKYKDKKVLFEYSLFNKTYYVYNNK